MLCKWLYLKVADHWTFEMIYLIRTYEERKA